MKTLVIIPCGKSKVWDRYPKAGPVPARLAYVGTPFKVNRAYAERVGSSWLILSAKYGFISPDFVISGPYEVSFKHPETNPVAAAKLRRQANRIEGFDRIIGIGGAEYRETMRDAFEPVVVEFPFAGLSIGKMMQAVKKATPLKGFWA